MFHSGTSTARYMFDIDRSNFQDVKVAENKKSASGFNFAANIPIGTKPNIPRWSLHHPTAF